MENKVKNEAVQDVTVTISGIAVNDKPVNIVRSADKFGIIITHDGVSGGAHHDCFGKFSPYDIANILLGMESSLGDMFKAGHAMYILAGVKDEEAKNPDSPEDKKEEK